MTRPHTQVSRSIHTNSRSVEATVGARRRWVTTTTMRATGRYAGLLFIIVVSASSGLVGGLAFASSPTP